MSLTKAKSRLCALVTAVIASPTFANPATEMAWLSWELGAMLFLLILVTIAIVSLLKLQRIQKDLKASEERFRLSLWGSGDELWDWHLEKNTVHRTTAEGNVKGYELENEVFPPNRDNIHPHDQEKVAEQLTLHLSGNTPHFEATYRIKNEDGNWTWVLDKGKIVHSLETNQPVRVTGTIKNIDHLKQTEDRLQLFARCLQNISDAIVILDPDFVIVDSNVSYNQLTGKTRDEIVGTPFELSFYSENYLTNLKESVQQQGRWNGELKEVNAEGNLFHVEFSLDPVLDSHQHITHYVGVMSDITHRKASEDKLRRLSFTDSLTGLPNRTLFSQNLNTLVQKNIRHALLVFDLDNFKKINDSLGHQLGDQLLVLVAERIRRLKSQQRHVYRLGGDEFAMTIENTNDLFTITGTARQVLDLIYQPYHINNHEIVVSSSIGIVLYPEDGTTPENLLRNADTSMYHAKAEGNTYLFFNDSMNQQAVKRFQIENLIRHGLKEDAFSVFYQPKIDISSNKVVGMEALVRFITPKRGIISPLTFIPVAEETGQIVDIGEIVLQKSCIDAKRWIDKGLFDGRVAVNLSARQFSHPSLSQRILDILQETELSPEHIELEITEGTVMHSPKDAIVIMKELRDSGMHLAIDDFGTGYSSLAYLKQFPINTLKIDKAFIDDMESEEGRNMVDTIITIANNLKLTVVAEGVETEQQLAHLSDLHCDLVQGYYYSRPLNAEEFEAFLKENQSHIDSTNSEPANLS